MDIFSTSSITIPRSKIHMVGEIDPYEVDCLVEKICNEMGYLARLPIISPNNIKKYIKTVIYHEPATIVKWKDGTKTVVKCDEYDTYDKEKGLMACIIKKLTGNTGRWNEILKEWVDYEDS